MLKARICACLALAACVLGAIAATAGALPDRRAWELVSPPDKNGADVLGLTSRTRAASDGNAVQFSSFVGFGDARGSAITFDYMSVRNGAPGTHGWATHAITPGNLDPIVFIANFFATGLDPTYTADLSGDLNEGTYLSATPLSAASPDTDQVLNLYQRDDLRTPGAGHYRQVSLCPGCSAPLAGTPADQPVVGGASADFSHVIFEDTQNLTLDAMSLDPAQPKLYEWANGVVRLAGILPDGTPAPNSQAGPGVLDFSTLTSIPAQYVTNAISSDGSRIFFTVRSADVNSGPLYLRSGNGTPGASTVQINVAEPTANPAPLNDARFSGATPDGSKVFFTTKENLVAADTGNSNLTDLYVYDANASAGHHLTLISAADPGAEADVQNVIGESDDGHYAYFVSNLQLLNGAPPDSGVNRIYVWHDGVIHEVAALDQLDARSAAGVDGFRLGSKTARVSSDGTHLVFTGKSSGGAASDDLPHTGVGDACPTAGGCEEVYAYDATANGGDGQLMCASCHTPPSAPGQTDATFLPSVGRGYAWVTSHQNHPLSADGRFVFFNTGDRLVPEDSNGTISDVYEYDTVTHTVQLLSTGKASSQGSYFLEASANGRDAFFITRDRLVGWDTDVQMDLYDARIDGGFPEPASVPVPCAGDACHGAVAPGKSAGKPATSTLHGAGNVRAKPHKAKKCRKGHVRKRVHGKVRCVKRRHHHNAKSAAKRRESR